MIRGHVDARRQPKIPVRVRRFDQGVEVLDAVVDTGFNGFLALSPEVIQSLQWPSWGASRWGTGDGREVELPLYVATVVWDDRDRIGFALATAGGPLIGMALLEGYRLSIDAVVGGEVALAAR